jgi:putative methionine-R-sulfoxide reductase with GAF domain
LPDVARPNEPALDVAARMVAALERLDEESWIARRLAAALERARRGPEAGERAFARLEPGAARALRAAARIGRAEAAFDRGAVAVARDYLAGGHGLAPVDRAEVELAARWTLLQGWAQLLQGGAPLPVDAAAATPRSRSDAVLPLALVELRRRRPEWSLALSGRGKRRHPSATPPALSWSGSRRDLGAAVLAVLEVAPLGETELVERDLEPALEPRVAAWLAAERPERAALAASRPWLRHRNGLPLHGALSPRTQSIAAWPLCGRGLAAAPLAWIWLEFEHHLVPASETLEALASAWRASRWHAPRPAQPIRSSPSARPGGQLVREGEPRTRWVGAKGVPPAPAVSRVQVGAPRGALEVLPAPAQAAAFEDFARGLALRSRERRWWGIATTPSGVLALVASAANPCAEPEARTGSAAAGQRLERALRLREVLRHGGGALALDARSAAGLVVPVVSRGKVLGALVCESLRRGDFGGALAARLAARVRAGADGARIAGFRDWHLARHGSDVHFGTECPAVARLYESVLTAAARTGPVVVRGPAGAGKVVASRWIHFERSPAASWIHLQADRWTTWAALTRALDRAGEPAGAGALCVEGFLELRERHRARLAALAAPIAITLEAASLPPELARLAGEGEVIVPPLAERRGDLARLAQLFARSAAAALGLGALTIEKDAQAWLRRQPWPGNVRQLADLIQRAVVAGAPALGERLSLAAPDLGRCAIDRGSRASPKRTGRGPR